MKQAVLDSYTPDQLTAFAALTTAGIAFVAACVALWQVIEARRTRRETTQPFVVVGIEPSRHESTILNLVIENIGQTLATNVQFEFDPPLSSKHWTSYPQASLAHSVMLTEGFPSMPPGFRVERVFEHALERNPKTDDDGFPWRFKIRVRFQDQRGKHQKPLEYVVDFRPLADGSFLEVLTEHHAAKAIREIRDVLKRKLK